MLDAGGRKTVAFAVASGTVFGLPLLGVVGWVWTTDWRWAVTGLALGLVALVVGAQWPDRRTRR